LQPDQSRSSQNKPLNLNFELTRLLLRFLFVQAPDVFKSIQQHWEQRRLIQIVTYTHRALINYVAQKAVKITVVLLHEAKNAAALPIGFVAKHSTSVQVSLKSRLDVWLQSQVHPIHFFSFTKDKLRK